MKLFSVLCLLLLLSLPLQAGELYHIRRLSERDLTQTYLNLMRDACRHADAVWHESAGDPEAGYWGSGRSDRGDEGIRAVAGMVLTCGALVKYDDRLEDSERAARLRQVRRAIRYAVSSHRTGPGKCTDGKPWGGSWQSAMWTGTLAFGAWLTWDVLDADLRQGVERVVASEADRFLKSKPPAGNEGDTKAEENGWNMICLAVAANLLPAHPHAAAWNQKAIEYMVNTLSVPQDARENWLLDGRPVSAWFAGANLFPDFTLENHHIFHPSYMACSSYFLTQAAMYYTYGGHAVPQAATHHLLNTWRMFQTIILPSGECAYPQGMDWELHGLPYLNLYASLACGRGDPLAAQWEQNCLQYMRAWQLMCGGDLTVPGSALGFTRHAICAEQATYGFLAHKIFGPSKPKGSTRQAAARLRGVWPHPYVGFIAHRTECKFASFSWKNRIMGLLIPVGRGHNGNPFFSVPINGGLVGSFELTPEGATAVKVVEHQWRETPNGFVTTGTLLLNGGRLRQTLRVASAGRHTVIYEDKVTALTNVCVARELGLPVGVENDVVSGARRTVFYGQGRRTFDSSRPGPAFAVPGSWVNVDGRLGVLIVTGSGLSYQQGTAYDPHTAVRTDVLYGSYGDSARQFKAGETVARRIAVFYVEVTPKQTARLAHSVGGLNSDPGGGRLRVILPEGGWAATAPLDDTLTSEK